MLATVILSLFLSAVPASGDAPLVEWQELVVPGVCTLRVAVPQGWNAVLGSPAPGAVHVRLAPEDGPRAEVLITGLARTSDGALESNGDIKRATREMGEQMLAEAVEKKVVLERLDGRAGSGFFYSLTDQRGSLPEGAYRCMTQGIMAVGPLRLAVTVHAGEADSAAKAAAFDLLRTAECTPEPPASHE
jgi:hypothetical protein